jgi:hypothetical protein
MHGTNVRITKTNVWKLINRTIFLQFFVCTPVKLNADRGFFVCWPCCSVSENLLPLFSRWKSLIPWKWRQQVYSRRWCQPIKLQRRHMLEDLNTHRRENIMSQNKIRLCSRSFPVTRGRMFIIDVTLVYVCCSKNVRDCHVFHECWSKFNGQAAVIEWTGRWLLRRSRDA